jgi:hypothetical protein
MDEVLRFAHSHATIAIRRLAMDEREHRQKLLYKFIHSGRSQRMVTERERAVFVLLM